LIELKSLGLMHAGMKNVCVNFCYNKPNTKVIMLYAISDCTLMLWKKCCTLQA